jgi:hypothetical protein
MAKAGKKSITWVLLSEAKARAFEAYEKTVGSGHADEFAERHILTRIQSGQTRWWRRHAEGSEQELVGRPEFFRNEPTAREAQLAADAHIMRLNYVTIDWANSSAHRWGIDVYQIEVASDDLALPVADFDDEDPAFAKVWVPREARSLKRAGKLDAVRSRTKLAELLIAVGREKGRPEVGVPYVRDNLEPWGCWPISEIKI